MIKNIKLNGTIFNIDVKYDSNYSLAIDYYLNCVRENLWRDVLVRNSLSIACADQDILAYYETYGNLEELKIKNIGKTIKKDLCRILK